MNKVTIIMPAYNEEKRIQVSLGTSFFFNKVRNDGICDAHFLIVLNGCVDHTLSVVKEIAHKFGHCSIINIPRQEKVWLLKLGLSER